MGRYRGATNYHIFEVHQYEMRTTKKGLCYPLLIGERMYPPPNREQKKTAK